MSFFSVLATVLFSSSLFAANKQVFQIFRKNYYEHRTMVYDLQYDSSTCRLTGSEPIRVYFVDTDSGQPVSGFSNHNRRYFWPRYMDKTASGVSFTFQGLQEVSKKRNENLFINVGVESNNQGCKVVSEFVSQQKNLLTSQFHRVEMEFVLEEKPLVGLQPADIKWIKILGARNICLWGKCL